VDWSAEEIEATVSAYLKMLELELAGQNYSKTKSRIALLEKLNGRSEAAIEMKHRNISAVLAELGHIPIAGYKPLPNYQKALIAEITKQLRESKALDQLALAAVQLPATSHIAEEYYGDIEVSPPEFVRSEPTEDLYKAKQAIQRDYLDREAKNVSLGLAGEKFVLDFERWRLISAGHGKLADRIEHVSKTKGDGLGYDIESYEPDGKPRLIEVKTTAFGRHTPFFVSKNELEVSKFREDVFVLSRVFEFRKRPKIFQLRGMVSNHCNLDPISFRAHFF